MLLYAELNSFPLKGKKRFSEGLWHIFEGEAASEVPLILELGEVEVEGDVGAEGDFDTFQIEDKVRYPVNYHWIAVISKLLGLRAKFRVIFHQFRDAFIDLVIVVKLDHPALARGIEKASSLTHVAFEALYDLMAHEVTKSYLEVVLAAELERDLTLPLLFAVLTLSLRISLRPWYFATLLSAAPSVWIGGATTCSSCSFRVSDRSGAFRLPLLTFAQMVVFWSVTCS